MVDTEFILMHIEILRKERENGVSDKELIDHVFKRFKRIEKHINECLEGVQDDN